MKGWAIVAALAWTAIVGVVVVGAMLATILKWSTRRWRRKS